MRALLAVGALLAAVACDCPEGTRSVQAGVTGTDAACRERCTRTTVSYDGWSPPSQEWIDEYEADDPFLPSVPEPVGKCYCCDLEPRPRPQQPAPKRAPRPFGPRRPERPVYAD